MRGSIRRNLTLVVAVTAAVLPMAASATAHREAAFRVPAEIASDCSQDVTQPLLDWIASVPDGSVLAFGSRACYRIEGTLELSDRSGLTFEGNGSTFRSRTPPSD